MAEPVPCRLWEHHVSIFLGLDGTDRPSVTSRLSVVLETSHSANSHLVPLVSGIKEVPSEGV